MTKKIIDIDNEFQDLENNFFNESLINRRTANIRKANDPEWLSTMSKIKKDIKRPDMIGGNNPAFLPHVREAKKARLTGVPKSKEQVEKYKQTMKLKPKIVCPYCGLSSRSQGNMNRYHLNKYCQK